jgi:UrcA family protein
MTVRVPHVFHPLEGIDMARVRKLAWLFGAIGLMSTEPATAQALAADPAQANEHPQAEATGPESDIVVEAPRLLPVPQENLPTEPATKALATVKIFVLYRDLDLSRPADAGRLMERIARTAQQACNYLDGLYPLVNDPDCAKRAAATATPAARAAIAAAAGRAEGREKP